MTATNDSTERPMARPWDEETDRDAVWEPWVPEIGQRVRVQWRGDCSGAGSVSHSQPAYGSDAVIDHLPTDRSRGDWIGVLYQPPLTVVSGGQRWRLHGAQYRQDELVPLPADPAQAAGEEG